MRRGPDPFDELAGVILDRATRAASRAAPSPARTLRFVVTRTSPLTVSRGDLSLRLDEEDVSATRAVDVSTLSRDDVVEVREDDDGWTITGVLA